MLFSISPKRIPPSFHGPLTEEEMREDPGPEQVGLGYRAVSAVGVTEDVLVRFIVGYDILVDCWERLLYSKYAFLGALRSAAQMVSYEVSIGLILITVLICVGSCNLSEIVMAQKQIWFGIPLFPVLVMFFISCLAETNRAPSDLPEAEAELVAGYNVEYARDAILNSSLLAEANVSGTHSDLNKGWVFTNFQIQDLGTKKRGRALFILHSKLMNVGSEVFALLSKRGVG